MLLMMVAVAAGPAAADDPEAAAPGSTLGSGNGRELPPPAGLLPLGPGIGRFLGEVRRLAGFPEPEEFFTR